jgi:amino acid transporter
MLINSSIGISGLVVLGGHTSVKEPKANFRNAFDGSDAATVYGTTNALVKVMFSYAGFENAFNVVNEVRVRVDASVIIMVSLLTYQ